ncbi:hypothetical protein MLD52_21470 [Puniceicoccaceae bacterium K14]|nr:hypothetical protein [Puniceicoccaceae bacterium K14]
MKEKLLGCLGRGRALGLCVARRGSPAKDTASVYPLQENCLQNTNRKTRTPLILIGTIEETFREKMKVKIDFREPKKNYGKRVRTVG